MNQLDLFAEPAPAESTGFAPEELAALRWARLTEGLRVLRDLEFWAAWEAVKRRGLEPDQWPIYLAFHGKVVAAKAMLAELPEGVA